MNSAIQSDIILVYAKVSKAMSAPAISSAIDSISKLIGTIRNLWWLILGIITTFILIATLISVRRKTNKYTKEQINRLIKNGKYIPGIFVELNESKEILRYLVYSKYWKNRLINGFNSVYDNSYGDILKKACTDKCACFHLNKIATLDKIEKQVNSALILHNGFKERNELLSPDYKESQYLFEIVYYAYTESFGVLQKYTKAANGRYLILTGSAGNGKTNLLCSISELLIQIKEAVVFLNSRDIEGNILDFLFNELRLPNIYKKYKVVYLKLVNSLLTIQRKHLFIIIDAINENDNDGFSNRIVEFCNKIFKYSRIKVIVSCRNEYYQERFRESLVEKIDESAFEIDLKEQRYTTAAIDRIIKAYSKHFNYIGTISTAVQNVLCKQLLLLRIFFEVYKDSNLDVLSVRKHEIFAQYIETVKKSSGKDIENLLDTLVDSMLDSNNFDGISMSELLRSGVNSDFIKETIDSNVLINKRLVSHEGTIACCKTEVVYFVFDEMRDYYLARRILLKNISIDSVDGDAILAKIKRLKETGASCAEGITHYIYMFFRTDKVVLESGKSEMLCNAVLSIYSISDGQVNWTPFHNEEFNNLGLKIILTSGLPKTDFEVDFIRNCLRIAPFQDSEMVFSSMLEGTLYNGNYNLDTYLDILLGIKDKNAIRNALRSIIASNISDHGFISEDFIKYHMKLSEISPESALQIQKVAELFLYCFELNNTELEDQLIDYFYNLPTHDKVQQEMIVSMSNSCGIGVIDYE
jgi:NACHT domain.